MENNNNQNIENANTNVSDTASARNALQDLALTLYGCSDGSVVTNPADCRPMNSRSENVLPNVTIG